MSQKYLVSSPCTNWERRRKGNLASQWSSALSGPPGRMASSFCLFDFLPISREYFLQCLLTLKLVLNGPFHFSAFGQWQVTFLNFCLTFSIWHNSNDWARILNLNGNTYKMLIHIRCTPAVFLEKGFGQLVKAITHTRNICQFRLLLIPESESYVYVNWVL